MGVSEHITDEQIEQLSALADEIVRAPSRFEKRFVVETMGLGVADLCGVIDRLRAQLAAIGETEVEWAADGPGGWMQWPVAEQSEKYARAIVENAARVGLRIPLKRRLAGEWREVSDA